MDYLAQGVDGARSGAPSSLARVSQAIYVSHHKKRNPPHTVADTSSGDIIDDLAQHLPREVDRFAVEPVTRPEIDSEHAPSVVLVRGVRVQVPAAQLTRLDDGRLAASIPAIRVNLSPGYVSYLHQDPTPSGRPDSLLRLYVGISDAAAAPHIWREVLGHLCERGLRFTAKCLHLREAYPASDALVVYTNHGNFKALGELARKLEGMPGMFADSSVFTWQLAPGCAVAVEVRGTQARPISFGEHRASALARGLLQAYSSGSTDPESVASAVTGAFEEDGIDPARPHLPLRHTEFSNQVRTWLESAP
uniref:T3SS effector HopA1 family protein n=1 Tax=Promicromonospora sp. CA-294714 TaxID=3240019 RepID=UPI003F49AAE6